MFKRANFVERSIMGALSFLKDSVLADAYAAQKGFLQARDPCVKAVTILLLLLSVLFTRDILFLAGMYCVVLVLTHVSSISVGFFLKRTWFFIPFFSLVIAIPALFDVFTPGQALWSFKVLGIAFTVTRQGLDGAALFTLRVLTSVSLVVLLALTTKHSQLLRVLRIFKIPQVFVMTIGMCYRYIYLFVEIIENTYTAIKSRVGVISHVKKGQQIVAWNIAHLWQRSYYLNTQVYNAMLSRGYRGEPRVLDEGRPEYKDWLWLSGVAAFFMIILWKHYLN